MMLNEEEMQQFMQHPDSGPVVMINLLKFRRQTEDGESGEAAYQRYTQNVAPLLAKVGGKVLWYGLPQQLLIGGEEDRWDRVLLVEYPSRAAFLQMVNEPEFQTMQQDRLAALERTVLLASTTMSGGQ